MGLIPPTNNSASDASRSGGQDLSVAIGRWGISSAPGRLHTLLGSCVGIVLHDRAAKIGGLAHIVLPDSRGCRETPGKFADTAIPAMIDEMERLLQGKTRGRLIAKIAGGASMFQVSSSNGPESNIGESNRLAVERVLASLRIPILARDLGGNAGRRLTFDTATGIVSIRVPGGESHEI